MGACAAVLEGEAGVGKTALWRRAVQEARDRGWRILPSAPTGSEARLAFAALGDLLDRDLDEVAPSLPRPQRLALERALLRRAGAGGRALVDERTIGVATLSALRALALRGPLVVAIDDLQWVDPASAAVLRFALRRLAEEPVFVLATRRLEPVPHGGAELDRILGDERVAHVRVPSLSVGAIHDLLVARLGFDPSRPILLRLHQLTGGNAFYALEIGAGADRPEAPNPPRAIHCQSPAACASSSRRALPGCRGARRAVLLAGAALARPTRSLLAGLDEAGRRGVGRGAGRRRDRALRRRTHPLHPSALRFDPL